LDWADEGQGGGSVGGVWEGMRTVIYVVLKLQRGLEEEEEGEEEEK